QSLNLFGLTNARIEDINLKNSKNFHIKLDGSQDVTFYHLNIYAPGNSPNTDGIHMGRSSNIRILNSVIATGDDCISIGPGTSNVNITGIFCGPGHGISIRSLGGNKGEQDVSLITVKNCTLTDTLTGLRIKTFAPSEPLTVSTITYQQIIMKNVETPIYLDQHYCPSRRCPKGQADSSVQIKGVKFIDVRGSSGMSIAANLDCSRIKPCQDIQFSGVNINFKGQSTIAACSNADTKFVGPYQVPSKCSAPALILENKLDDSSM
ncbi:exopolygalacturonase, partial [Phtheirospermum japonicum]